MKTRPHRFLKPVRSTKRFQNEQNKQQTKRK
jgi:hypothetical protein